MSETRLPEAVCGACGATGSIVRFERSEREDVRGFPVDVIKTLRRCGRCGEEFENGGDPDWRIDAYAQFRKAKGWATPEQIIEWRRRYDLSQEEVGRLLGWGEITLGRYERGALQTDSHNTQLAQLMGEGGIARAVAARPDALPATKKAAIRAKLEAEYDIPTIGDIRRFRRLKGKTLGEAGIEVFVSAETWAAWESGATFPDARAGRLIRLMMADNGVIEQVRAFSGVTGASGAFEPLADALATAKARRTSPESKAFWASMKDLGFVPTRLKPLFPSWVSDAELHRMAAIELGSFAQVHMGAAADFDGTARLVSAAPAYLKATKHRENPAHAAAVSMSLAAARLVAQATIPDCTTPLPSAAEVRASILRATNQPFVNFANLAAFLWARGIPIVHVPKLPVKAKGMDGLVTRVEGRPVIVLSRDQELSDWMLFVLAHEGGHVGKGHLSNEEGAAVVDGNISDLTPRTEMLSNDEIEANTYAQEILVEQGSLFAIDDRIPAAEQFAADAIQFGHKHCISPGHVVLNAVRHTPNPPFNLMPLAMKTLKIIDRKLETPPTSVTCRNLAIGNLDFSKLRPESAEYLEKLGVV